MASDSAPRSICLQLTDRVPLVLVLVLVVVGWMPFLWHFDDLAVGDFDEYAATAEAVRKCVLEFHDFPFWNPWHFGGTPLFARPLTATFALDTLYVLLFGTLGGLKIAMVCYAVIGAAGMWALLGHMGVSRLSRFHGSAIFGLQGALAIHVAAGHLVMAAIAWAPWLVLSLLQLKADHHRGGIAFGVFLAVLVNHSVHYVSLMLLMLLLVLYLFEAHANASSRRFMLNSVMALLVLVTLGSYRIIVTLDLLRDYPREMAQRASLSPGDLLLGLVSPGQSLDSFHRVGPGWGWWEIGCYVGPVALLLGLVSAWGRWRWYHWGTLVTAMLALDSGSRALPGYWLREVPPFSSMVTITRWRLVMVFCIAVATAAGLDRLLAGSGRRARLILVIAVGVSVGGLLVNAWSTWRDISWVDGGELAVPVGVSTDTIITVDAPVSEAHDPPVPGSRHRRYSEWACVHRNLGMLFAYEQLLGYPGEHETYSNRRFPYGTSGYRGELVPLRGPLSSVTWSPSSMTMTATADGTTVWISQNPSSYWRLAGHGRLFPAARVFETAWAFVVPVPAASTVRIHALPPLHELGLATTAGGFLGLLLMSFYLRRAAVGTSR